VISPFFLPAFQLKIAQESTANPALGVKIQAKDPAPKAPFLYRAHTGIRSFYI